MQWVVHANGNRSEVGLEWCPNGHRLGPRQALVGWRPCGWAGAGGHRTWFCRACSEMLSEPPCTVRAATAGDLGLVPPSRGGT